MGARGWEANGGVYMPKQPQRQEDEYEMNINNNNKIVTTRLFKNNEHDKNNVIIANAI